MATPTAHDLIKNLESPPTAIVVIGGGIAGLVAAFDCARPGFEVTVIESSDRVGGCVASHEVAGLVLDSGAESFATRGGHVAALIDELGLGDSLVAPNPAGAWVRLPNGTVPLPKAGLLGIPSSPLATDVIAAIGWRGALRAYLDRIMPVLKIGEERSLGVLVRRRMGVRVLERLVAPVATGVYSAQPDELDLAVVAPGLNSALTRQGSLSGAVGALRASAKAGSAVGGIEGGMSRLTDALVAAIAKRGGVVRRGVAVVSVESTAGTVSEGNRVGVPGSDDLAVDPGSDDPAAGPGSDEAAALHRWQVALDDGTTIDADVVVVATPGPVALRLLRDAAPELAELGELTWPEASSVELATLVVDVPELSVAPRGTGVLVAETAHVGVTAKALTHATAKWSWLADAAGVGRHIIRLSYGRAGVPSETRDLEDSEFQELARRDAETLLDIPLPASSLVGFARTSWTNALPFAAVGERDRIVRVRERIDAVEGIEVTGAWLAGTGLAAVVPDAREAAHRVRGLRWKALTENL